MPVDGAESRLERIDAAEASRTDSRAACVGAERSREHAGRDGRRGAARRPAWRSARVERIARACRISAAEADSHSFADQHSAALAQCPHRGGIRHRLMAAEQFAAELGRHVVGLDQILDPNRHAVDRAERPASFVTCARLVCCVTRALQVEKGECHDCGFERLDARDAAFEISARRVGARSKPRGGVVEAQHAVR